VLAKAWELSCENVRAIVFEHGFRFHSIGRAKLAATRSPGETCYKRKQKSSDQSCCKMPIENWKRLWFQQTKRWCMHSLIDCFHKNMELSKKQLTMSQFWTKSWFLCAFLTKGFDGVIVFYSKNERTQTLRDKVLERKIFHMQDRFLVHVKWWWRNLNSLIDNTSCLPFCCWQLIIGLKLMIEPEL